MLIANSKYAAHGREYIPESGLGLRELARDFDLDGGKYGNLLADHIGRDNLCCPSAKVRPALRGGMERPGLFKYNNIGIPAHSFARPSCAGINTKQTLLGRESRKDIAYAFTFAH
jgi:hypothetical protein